ncbi:MAG: 4-(cytidine 5'-diphospho)-2-C-methyl-D-erythritol kinase [Acetobacteraceae bacterium]|nr:4-(cytidine 5'-diphospho)-2-C-methyl-D-erythritol kinase [Acetobacteraceae bacterium]
MTPGGAALDEAAPGKINLFLHVLGRLPNGYHQLDSLAVFADAADRLSAEPDDALSLAIDGPFGSALAGEGDNLVLRAARLLADAAGVRAGAKLSLRKNLPVASGIGGGSADAAAALRLLARLWDVSPETDLAALSLRLGADVPVCLLGRTARMGGIGDCLAPGPALPDCGLVLVNPGVPLETAAVFRERRGAFGCTPSLPPAWGSLRAMAEDLGQCRNDLQSPAIRLCPEIAAVLAALEAIEGCALARMSGSGATCFGLFATPSAARAAASALASPGWWCWGGGLATAPGERSG